MMSYFSLDHLLTDAIQIPVITRCTLPKCGFLDSRCTSEDLPKNSSVELPIWLITSLSNLNIFSVEPNNLINEKTCAELAISPMEHIPDIEPSNNFFEAAELILELMSKKENDLKEKYKQALEKSKKARLTTSSTCLSKQEEEIIKKRKFCEDELDQIMQVKFK